jgi:hypothetical protein
MGRSGQVCRVGAEEKSIRILVKHASHASDRFRCGDTVAPANAAAYYRVFDMRAPVWRLLTPEASFKIRKGNYERIFDAARQRVRVWEQANAKPPTRIATQKEP